jgi:hypothetical protein
MTLITGTSGRLNLKDSVVKFGNWSINAKIKGQSEPDNNDWSGSFESQKSDFGKVFSLLGEQINADFYGDVNYNGNIIINDGITDFKGTGKLKKMLRPQ